MALRERPLSPFMQYRWQYSNTLSILHRITGVALAAGFFLFVYWLVSLAGGETAYAQTREILGGGLARAIMVGWSFAFFYHLLNGVRHLVWDTGRGFERRTARLSGWTAFIAALALTAGWWLAVGALLATGAA
jgi:succinate dehydrogenase cytochrome b subunit